MSSIGKQPSIADLPLHADEVAAALHAGADSLIRILEQVPDPAAPVKGLVWTVGDVAAHLAETASRYRTLAEGGPELDLTVAQRADAISQGLAGIGERDPRQLTDRIATDLHAIAAAIDGRSDTALVNWYRGTPAPVPLLGGTVLAEVLVHGWDIASTEHANTFLPPEACYLAILSAAAVTPLLMTTAGLRASATLQFRITGYPPVTVQFDRGTTTATTEPHGHADVWFAAAPAPFLLWAYTRTGQLKPFLNRSVRVGGRRPWLAAAIPRWFEPV